MAIIGNKSQTKLKDNELAINKAASPGNLTIEIEVSPEMVDAGLEELREHHYGDDLRYTLESVFRAMAYTSAAASATKASK